MISDSNSDSDSDANKTPTVQQDNEQLSAKSVNPIKSILVNYSDDAIFETLLDKYLNLENLKDTETFSNSVRELESEIDNYLNNSKKMTENESNDFINKMSKLRNEYGRIMFYNVPVDYRYTSAFLNGYNESKITKYAEKNLLGLFILITTSKKVGVNPTTKNQILTLINKASIKNENEKIYDVILYSRDVCSKYMTFMKRGYDRSRGMRESASNAAAKVAAKVASTFRGLVSSKPKQEDSNTGGSRKYKRPTKKRRSNKRKSYRRSRKH